MSIIKNKTKHQFNCLKSQIRKIPREMGPFSNFSMLGARHLEKQWHNFLHMLRDFFVCSKLGYLCTICGSALSKNIDVTENTR